jgi:hypothetical protein
VRAALTNSNAAMACRRGSRSRSALRLPAPAVGRTWSIRKSAWRRSDSTGSGSAGRKWKRAGERGKIEAGRRQVGAIEGMVEAAVKPAEANAPSVSVDVRDHFHSSHFRRVLRYLLAA